ncbi:hypothetical protein ES705_44015 [subsurface metagenome]
MKKILIVLSMIVMASFIMGAGCGVTPPIDPPVENNPPEITSSAITSGKVGVVYNYGVEATDPEEDVLTYSLTEKPLNMSIVATTGVISWTPTDAGVFGVTVKAYDGALGDSQSFNITVVKADEPDPDPDPDPDPELQLIGITVKPEKMELIVGGTDTIDSVIACYEFRSYDVDIDFDDCLFLTSNSKVATVKLDEDTVTVTAVGEGTADILVSYGGKVDTLAVTVIAKVVDYIIVDPDDMDLVWDAMGDTVEVVSVKVYYNNGDIAEIIDFADEDCTFNSNNPNYVEVNENGVVTIAEGVGGGPSTIETTITVKYGGKTDTIEVELSGIELFPPPE